MPEKETVSREDYERLRKDYQQTLDALSESLDEIDQLKAGAAEAGHADARIAELEAKLRTATHAKAFAKLADELGIPEDLRDDVFQVSGYKAEADEPDADAMRKHFAKYLETRPSLTGKGKSEPNRYAKGEGSSRGSVDDGKTDKKQVTRAQLMDADWTEANAKLLSDVNAFEIVEAA